jgi:hypothetical protein
MEKPTEGLSQTEGGASAIRSFAGSSSDSGRTKHFHLKASCASMETAPAFNGIFF